MLVFEDLLGAVFAKEGGGNQAQLGCSVRLISYNRPWPNKNDFSLRSTSGIRIGCQCMMSACFWRLSAPNSWRTVTALAVLTAITIWRSGGQITAFFILFFKFSSCCFCCCSRSNLGLFIPAYIWACFFEDCVVTGRWPSALYSWASAAPKRIPTPIQILEKKSQNHQKICYKTLLKSQTSNPNLNPKKLNAGTKASILVTPCPASKATPSKMHGLPGWDVVGMG